MSINQPGGASSPVLDAQDQAALFLMQRPTRLITIPDQAASTLIVGGAGILIGYVLTESGLAVPSSTYLGGSSQGAAQANNAALAAGGAGTQDWVTGFEVTGNGATAAGGILVTLTGVAGGTLNYIVEVPAIAGAGQVSLVVNFGHPGLPAAAFASAITLNVPSFGAGNLNAAASIHGYRTAPGGVAGVASGYVATYELLDGTDAQGELIVAGNLGAGASSIPLGVDNDGPMFRRGLFLAIATGTVEGSVWVKI